MPSDALAVLHAIPTDQIAPAIIRLSGRLLTLGATDLADDLLSVDEAAKLLRCTKQWLYRHGDELGVVRLSPRKIVFPRRTVLARVPRRGRRS